MDQPLQSSAPEVKRVPENLREASILNTSEVATRVEQNVVGVSTSGNANEMLAGLEGKLNESGQKSVSEKKSDPVPKSTSGQAATAQAAVIANLQNAKPLPPQNEIVQTVRVALRGEVKALEGQVRNLKKNALKFAHQLAETFEKLRVLKSLLHDILTFTADFLKMLYEKVTKKESLATVKY